MSVTPLMIIIGPYDPSRDKRIDNALLLVVPIRGTVEGGGVR